MSHELSSVPIAAVPSTLVGTGDGDTAPRHVNKPATGSDKWHVTNPTLRLHGNATCAHCGRPYTARRRWSRFCSGACRTAAFRAKQDGAATEKARNGVSVP